MHWIWASVVFRTVAVIVTRWIWVLGNTARSLTAQLVHLETLGVKCLLLVDSESFARTLNRARNPSQSVCMGKIASQVGIMNPLLTSANNVHCLLNVSIKWMVWKVPFLSKLKDVNFQRLRLKKLRKCSPVQIPGDKHQGSRILLFSEKLWMPIH